MRKSILLVFLFLFFGLGSTKASHIMGGEITWECISSGPNAGKYVFHLVLYRDCNGVALTGNQTLRVVNYSPDTTFTMYEVSAEDVSPTCDDTISFNQENCGAGPPYSGYGGTGDGAVQRNIYISDTITLSGTPPTAGWIFIWNSCCRNSAIDNFPQPGSASFTLRAVMYPYTPPGATSPLPANPCYDNSPVFKEDPAMVLCTGDTFNYNHNASDLEFDSLAYHVGYPLTDYSAFSAWTFDPAAPAAWQNPEPWFPNAGYPINNLYLPNSTINANNSLATLDSITGEIMVENFTAGSYVTVIKVEAWRCGQLIALIYRDLQVVYRACQTTIGGNTFDNDPPVVTFNNLGSSSFTQVGAFTWADTVVAGFPVSFQFNGVDQDTVNSNTPYCGGISPCSQILYLEASGAWYGDNFTSTTAGCPQPPCATLNPAPPFSGWVFLGTNFNWETSCDHLSYSSAGCSSSNTYTFLIKLKDNMCPAPGVRYGTFVITVLPGPAVGPELKCVSVLPNGDNELEWIPPAPADTGVNFDLYYIYHSNTPGGPFTLIDSVMDYSTSNYVHMSPGGQSYYYMTVKGGCDYISPTSDTVTTIELSVQALGGGSVAQLDWNQPVNPLPNSAAWYYIYREYPSGVWNLIDSTTSLTYFDTITICDDQINYQVGLYDSIANCISLSSVAGDQFGDITAPAGSPLDSASVNIDNNLAVIGWPESNTPDAVSYVVYILSPGGSWLPIDTINDITITSYLHLNSNAGFQSEQYAYAVLDSCDNRSPISPLHRTIFMETDLDICLQEVAISWSTYTGWPVQTYNIIASDNGGTRYVLGSVGPSDTSFVHTGLINNTSYCYFVQAVGVNGELASSNQSCVFAQIPVWPSYQYIPRVSVNNDFQWVDIELYIDDQADISYYRYEQGFDYFGPFMPVFNEPKPATGQDIISTHVTNLFNQGPLFYRVVAVDTCGEDAFVTDTVKTIFLEVGSGGDLSNVLTWDDYVGWPTGVDQYDVWRSIDGAPGVLIHSLTPTGPGPYTFTDDLNQSLGPNDAGGSFCYIIDASENAGNPYGFTQKASYSNIACAEQNPRIFVPNTFTPDGNGMNEVWKPSITFGVANQYELLIYDRWGKNIFYTTNVDEGWDGTYDGELMEQGTYVYYFRFLDLEGEEQKYRGTITLLR